MSADPLRTLSLYWHTVRHLALRQILTRIWFRLYRPRPSLAPAPPLRPPAGWVPPIPRESCLLSPTTFYLLSEVGVLDRIGWDGPPMSKLWRYHQHYFDDLCASDADKRTQWHEQLLLRWVDENPPGQGVGWEPYPTARRIVNWIKWTRAGHVLPARCLDSLAVQARWLARRLEHHLMGNHLLVNAKGLLFAGLFFSGIEAKQWLERGLRLLRDQLAEQILSDWGHIERSPMYHALILEDLLDMKNMVQSNPPCGRCRDILGDLRLDDCIIGMLSWLQAMIHPDGEIPFFNDAALGLAPSYRELVAYTKRLGLDPPDFPAQRVQPLLPSGYVRLARGQATVLLDVAPLGPDYLLGHAHADTLSFELSVGSRRVLVNSGTSCYGESAERLRQRGTAAHNTVVIAGLDSSEVWKGFRVARRAQPVGLHIDESKAAVTTVSCGHTGYRWLRGRPHHRRQWTLWDEGLEVLDTVTGQYQWAEARFHWHPAWMVTLDGCDGLARHRTGCRLRWRVVEGRPSLERTTYHPRFGMTEPNTCLSVQLINGRSRVRLLWN